MAFPLPLPPPSLALSLYHIATLALLNSLHSPTFAVASSSPLPSSLPGLRWSSRSFRHSRVSATPLVSVAILFIVLVVQFLRPSPVLVHPETWQSRQDNHHAQRPKAVCLPQNIFAGPLPTSRLHKMSLLDEARRVAKEFEYPAEEVNKGVKEFIRQMGRCQWRLRSELEGSWKC